MIDFINNGRGRVKMVFLTSLFSNGHYLENGRSYVFTYNNNSFYFNDVKLDSLIEEKNKILSPFPIEELLIENTPQKMNDYLTVTSKLNCEISKNIKSSYKFIYYNKNKKPFHKILNSNYFSVPKDFTFIKSKIILDGYEIPI